METIGRIIREYREKEQISLRKFAKACDLSPAYISKLEHHTCEYTKGPVPSGEAFATIARVMGTDIATVMRRVGYISTDDGEVADTLPTVSVSASVVRPLEHVPMTTENILAAVKEGKLLLLPFPAPRKGDRVWVYMKEYQMSVAFSVTLVDGGVYEAYHEAGGSIRFNIYDIGHSVFLSPTAAQDHYMAHTRNKQLW